ncbi:hypothetical protein [Methylomarinum vadi]|nr:hypothetical protein [Methylomarinum vadi]
MAIEELLFWTGLAALLAGSGWISLLGGVLIAASLIIAFQLFK